MVVKTAELRRVEFVGWWVSFHFSWFHFSARPDGLGFCNSIIEGKLGGGGTVQDEHPAVRGSSLKRAVTSACRGDAEGEKMLIADVCD